MKLKWKDSEETKESVASQEGGQDKSFCKTFSHRYRKQSKKREAYQSAGSAPIKGLSVYTLL